MPWQRMFFSVFESEEKQVGGVNQQLPPLLRSTHFTHPHPSMPTTLRNSPLPPIPTPCSSSAVEDTVCVCVCWCVRDGWWSCHYGAGHGSGDWSPVSDVMEFLISCRRVSHPPFIKLARELRETRPTRSRTHPKCPRLIPLKSASIE